MSSRARVVVFALIAVAMLAVAGVVVARGIGRRGGSTPVASTTSTAPASASAGARLFFRNLELEPAEDFGKLAVSPLETPGAGREMTGLRCVRAHFAAGQGLCLEMEDEGGRKATLRTFGPGLHPRWSLPLDGLPSRARVSPDGRLGAVTVFVTGHGYSDEGMSTRTTIVDLTRDQVLVEDLEKLEVWRDGARFHAPDFNFWGVTFGRGTRRFHATLSSGGTTWLVEGDLDAGRMRTLRENVECPSLSPDGTRVAFKKRVGGPGMWRLHVLDLATLEERRLAGEDRPIDDQVEWLDDGHVLYKHGPTVWALEVAGGAPATLFLARGSSPAVVRAPP